MTAGRGARAAATLQFLREHPELPARGLRFAIINAPDAVDDQLIKPRVNDMRKTLTILAAAATIAVSAIALPGQADARWGGRGGWGHGGWGHRGWGGPFVGGLAAGALLGGAYAYGPGYYGYYGAGPYAAYGGCYTRRTWTPYGWRWRRFCY